MSQFVSDREALPSRYGIDVDGYDGAVIAADDTRFARMKLLVLYPSLETLRKAAPALILSHNLHGVDIAPRCAQIAQLALWIRGQCAFKETGVPRSERPVTGAIDPGRSTYVSSQGRRIPDCGVGDFDAPRDGRLPIDRYSDWAVSSRAFPALELSAAFSAAEPGLLDHRWQLLAPSGHSFVRRSIRYAKRDVC
jgi:hypothetical protein